MDLTGPTGKGTALVTGGCRNLGLEISRGLIGCGYHVIATTRNMGSFEDGTLPSHGFMPIEADVSKVSGVKKAFDHINDSGETLRVLVNNASSFPIGQLLSMDVREMRRAYDSTLLSSFMCIKESVALMKAAGWGRIVNMGMAGTDIIKGYREVAAHASAKSALSVLTLSLAGELEGTGITINMVNPGPIRRRGMGQEEITRLSRISPTGSLTRAEDVVNEVVRLVRSDCNGEISTVL